MTRILTCVLMVILLQPAMAQRKINKTTKDPVYIYTVKVKGGSFDMGSDVEGSDRFPIHRVTLGDFSMGQYEITQAQWKSVMGNNPSTFQCEECPVTNVSWTDIQAFIEKLNAQSGKHYRLPTEAEWEYAARGGANEELVKESNTYGGVNELVADNGHKRTPEKYTTGWKYSGKGSAQEVAWFERNSNYREHPIGRKKANQLEIFDMSGNVEEWCADWYVGNYGKSTHIDNPQGPTVGNARVVRGGSWNSAAADITVTRRAAYLPDTRSAELGFRLVEDK